MCPAPLLHSFAFPIVRRSCQSTRSDSKMNHVPVHLELVADIGDFHRDAMEMPCDLLIVGLQCQQSKAENIFQKILDNFDISIFLAKSMYQRIKKYLQPLKGIDCISVPGVTFEDLASVKLSNANSSISEPFHREAQESHHNTSHNLPVYLIYLRCVCVCLMMFLNGVFDYLCLIIILCHVCLLQTFKCFLLWCFESRLGLRPKEWTMPARIIEAKACACWIISLDVDFVYFSQFQFVHA